MFERVPKVNQAIEVGKQLKLGIKSTDVLYVKNNRAQSDQRLNILKGKIDDIRRTYSGYLLAIKIDDFAEHVFMELPDYVVHNHHIQLEDYIHICLKHEKIIVFKHIT